MKITKAMSIDNKFLIFGPPRTGSSNLAKVIGSLYADQLNILYTYIGEPFNQKNLQMWYKNILEQTSPEAQTLYKKGTPKKLLTRSQIIEILDICYKNSCGIKHIDSPLSLYKNFSLLEYAMTRRYKIIFLTRDSRTLRDVSAQLATQTGAWSKKQMGDKKVIYDPIDIEDLKNRVHLNKKREDHYKDLMCDYDVYHASYEQVYSQKNQLNEIHKIMDYLEINREKLDMRIFDENMNYNDNKQNTSAVYNKIPNIEEVIQFAKEEYDDDISYIIDP